MLPRRHAKVLDFLRTSLKQNAEPGASEISTGAKAAD